MSAALKAALQAEAVALREVAGEARRGEARAQEEARRARAQAEREREGAARGHEERRALQGALRDAEARSAQLEAAVATLGAITPSSLPSSLFRALIFGRVTLGRR